MNALTKALRKVAVSRPVMSSSGAVCNSFTGATRNYVKVGDKVNITFVKDEPPILIKEDKEYPDWVFKLSERLPSKVALMDKFGPNGEGVDSMTTEEKKRLKRLLRLAIIKENNAASQTEA